MYTEIATACQPEQAIKSIIKRFDEAVITPYIQKELAIGLEKTLKQYHKLTDGIAYIELAKLK